MTVRRTPACGDLLPERDRGIHHDLGLDLEVRDGCLRLGHARGRSATAAGSARPPQRCPYGRRRRGPAGHPPAAAARESGARHTFMTMPALASTSLRGDTPERPRTGDVLERDAVGLGHLAARAASPGARLRRAAAAAVPAARRRDRCRRWTPIPPWRGGSAAAAGAVRRGSGGAETRGRPLQCGRSARRPGASCPRAR